MTEEELKKITDTMMGPIDEHIKKINEIISCDKDEMRRLSVRIDCLEHIRLSAEHARSEMLN